MESTNFLFGIEACQLLLEDGFEALLESIQEDVEFELFQFNVNSNPVDLLIKFQNWNDYAVISSDEYKRLLANA